MLLPFVEYNINCTLHLEQYKIRQRRQIIITLFTTPALKEQYLKCHFPGSKKELHKVVLGIINTCNKD